MGQAPSAPVPLLFESSKREETGGLASQVPVPIFNFQR